LDERKTPQQWERGNYLEKDGARVELDGTKLHVCDAGEVLRDGGAELRKDGGMVILEAQKLDARQAREGAQPVVELE
jgi:hypothetical protein